MVRVISCSNVGWGDYGASISDREVDGIQYLIEEPIEIDRTPKQVTLARRIQSGYTPQTIRLKAKR